jgi:O-antigen/teichoic acid export membrane protein
VVGVIEMVRACSYLVLVLVWVQQPSQALRIPIFFFLSTLLAALYGWTLFRRDYGGLRPQFDLMFWKRALRESLPLGLAFMLLQVYYLTDTIVLGLLRGAVSVGLYSAAYKTAAFVLAVGGLFFETIFPVIARYHEHARERLPWLLNSVLRVTLLLSIPMAVGGTVLSRPILTGLYGREYGAATIAFRLLIWAVAIELLGLNWGYALMACDRTNGYLKAVGLGAGLSVILNVALVPKLGLMGAGLARLASSALISLGLCLQFRRVSRVHALRYFLKPLLASALMAAAMLLLGHSWILQLALGIVVYSGTILAIGPAERDYAMRFANAILSAPSHKARQSAGPDHEISGREPATRPATASDV